MKEYVLVPKNGNGCNWYMSKDELFKEGLVKVNDHAGFETTVDIRNYNIYRMGDLD